MAIRLLSTSHIQVGSGYMPVRTGLVMVVIAEEEVVVIVFDPWVAACSRRAFWVRNFHTALYRKV